MKYTDALLEAASSVLFFFQHTVIIPYFTFSCSNITHPFHKPCAKI